MSKNAILLATYNGEKYIEALLKSLFNQTERDFTIYLHDDGSTDSTMEIVEKYMEKEPECIKLIEGAPTGSAKANFLYLLSMVEADNYLFCDQDDVWLPEKVELSLRQLGLTDKREGGPVCVFTDMYVTDAALHIISESFIQYIGRSIKNTNYTQILIDNPAAGCTMCINRELRDVVVEATKKVDLKNIPMHDALILELAALCGKIEAIDSPLVYYRQTGMNEMGAKNETDASKVGRNMADMARLSFFEKKKAFINEARRFAMEMLKVETIPEEKRKVLEDFTNISSKGKFARMRFYKKNNFTRANHNFWMRLFV